jgi:uncharacterized protein (DUF433 family)
MNAHSHPRIVVDPAVCGGRPTVAGTRMRVSDILEALASGVSEAELLAEFPYIAVEDIRACLDFAASISRRWDWLDEIAGALDEDFAAAALDRPGPDSYERPDISLD